MVSSYSHRVPPADEEVSEATKAQRERLDALYPKPTISDILTFRDRVQRNRSQWLLNTEAVRELRYHEDQTPDKYQRQLNIPEDRRFRTNLTGNEIDRVTALLNRNAPKVLVPPMGETNTARTRAEVQTRWGQQLLVSLERDAPLPLWSMGDDAAAECGLGAYEWYLTERWEEYRELADRRDGVTEAAERREIDAQLRAIGLPFAVRYVDPECVYWEPDDHGSGRAGRWAAFERKSYAQVFYGLRDKLSEEEWEEAQLPPIAALGHPDRWQVRYGSLETPLLYQGVYDDTGEVEVIRYHDRRWTVEAVAGKIVDCYEHGLPAVPGFLQFGKVTSSTYQGYQLRGVTVGMLEHERVLNDAITLWLDNQYTYGRPFPLITTDLEGSPLMDRTGNPIPINLSDPRNPPQLGPGQHVEDAFKGFTGQIDPNFLGMINSYFRASGLNEVAMGEAPGSDPSGYALNVLSSGAAGPYMAMVRNKQRVLEQIIDFSRVAVRDVIQGDVYLSVDAGSGDQPSVEYICIGPDEVDEVPCRVTIDPNTDAQRLAIAQLLSTAHKEGYVQKRTVQRYAYGSVIEDFDAEDRAIVRDQAMQALLPVIVDHVVQRVRQEGFPETLAGGGQGPGAMPQMGPQGGGGPMLMGAPGGPGPEPTAPTVGPQMAQASQAGAGALANMARGGQQPLRQGLPSGGPNP